MAEIADIGARHLDAIKAAMYQARMFAGMDQAAFARQMSRLKGETINRGRVSRWESGASVPDTMDLLFAAQLANVPVSRLFERDDFQVRLSTVERDVADLKRTTPGHRRHP